jgi:hypothetical protein
MAKRKMAQPVMLLTFLKFISKTIDFLPLKSCYPGRRTAGGFKVSKNRVSGVDFVSANTDLGI